MRALFLAAVSELNPSGVGSSPPDAAVEGQAQAEVLNIVTNHHPSTGFQCKLKRIYCPTGRLLQDTHLYKAKSSVKEMVHYSVDNNCHAMDDVVPTTNSFTALQEGDEVCLSNGPSTDALVLDSSPFQEMDNRSRKEWVPDLDGEQGVDDIDGE
ncbi:hypothetical protein Nepgr_014856 [Nepenthes gracilis]|uniref:Uncharacterized protein n=1 Tax=Nepenthes gracilis TaxID=150966 RepID=A0AAD3SLN7_NEPGR|nr:hypothetical protein Nepgr_014856 [Nepenthes gracilis]